MIEITVTPQDYILSDLISNLEMISTRLMPKTVKAVKMASAVIMHTWKSYALGAPIPGSGIRIKNPTGGYARTIKVLRLTPLNSIVYSDSKIAKHLEEGTEPLDMKKTHPYGPKSRVSKKGVPYNIIPFRHGIPGTLSYAPMPAELYAKIREEIKAGNVQLSQITKGKKLEPNYQGKLIPRANYKWGSRISSGIDKLEGMVVMNVGTDRSIRSQYMTFRVISANSPAFKWIRKARPALHLTEHVVRNTRRIVSEILEQGLKEDIGLA